MALILASNDDGIHAPGLQALVGALDGMAEVYVVAPDRERSATGRALTIHNPIRIKHMGGLRYSLTGTPTDCVAVGLSKVLPGRADLVVSGINHGPNLGDDITYSGTVAAAMEGNILNVPSVAFSLAMGMNEEPHFDTAAAVARRIVGILLRKPLPYDTLLNVNIPNVPLGEIAGMRFTRQGKRVYDEAIHESRSPWGDTCYWIGGGTPFWEHGEDTDIKAVQDKFVSITPLQLDLTNYWARGYLEEHWGSWTTEP